MQLPILVLTSAWKKARNKLVISFCSLAFCMGFSYAQPTGNQSNYSVLFYNVENLFDTRNDSVSLDDEFIPAGMKHWTSARMDVKLNKISKVIMSANGFQLPDLVGLCEVENRFVLERLLEITPLKKFGYRIIHKDSPDGRGIDVALLYRADRAIPIRYEYIPLLNNQGKVKSTREILHAVFQLGTDTLDLFVNHWPSRYQGQAETERARMQAARTLKQKIDELTNERPQSKIVVVGDFNDTPDNESLLIGLEARVSDGTAVSGELVNLSALWSQQGTIKHQQTWQVFDQIIVSDNLLSGVGLSCTPQDAKIVELPFLFEDDPTWGGKRLSRTYRGYEYAGGFADHLPVLLNLKVANQD